MCGAAFVDFIARNPEAGDVIPETGGVRKIRWSRQGSGKRGGVRVVYFVLPVRRAALSADGLREGAAREFVSGCEAYGAGPDREAQAGVAALEGETMNKFSKELIESLTEACEHAEGKSDKVGADRRGARRAGDPPAAAHVADGIRARIPDSARDD
jgi:hypothetical protein